MLIPELIRIMNHEDVQVVDVDVFKFGTAWNRTLVCVFVCDDDLQRLNKRCHAVGGLCSKSGKPHFHLTGTGPGGICWTRIAQPYPHGFARALSHCLLSDARQKFMNRKQ